MSEFLPGFEPTMMPFHEVRVVRALAQSIERHARTRVDDEEMSGYVLYDTDWRPQGSNSEEVFMGVIARKTEEDLNQLTVSFLSYRLDEESRSTNTREQYRYQWDSNGFCTGMKIFRETLRDRQEKIVFPLSSEDNQELLDRMQATSRSAQMRPNVSSEVKWLRIMGEE